MADRGGALADEELQPPQQRGEFPPAAQVVDGGRPEIVEVEAEGSLRLGGDDVTLEELSDRLASLYAADPALAVMIRGERAVPHGRMAEIYEACRGAGVRHVAISVRPRGETVRR